MSALSEIPTLSTPEPLRSLLEEPTYGKLKGLFIECLQSFTDDPQCSDELEAYLAGNNNRNYAKLKGLIPPPLVGKALTDGMATFNKSETFFTDYDKHFPEEFILSATKESYIIANSAAHDTRLYSPSCDPNGQDTSARAGMAYLHLLIIPRERVYNIVALDSPAIIEEMIGHFKSFWRRPDSIGKVRTRIQFALDQRVTAIEQAFAKAPSLSQQRMGVAREAIQAAQESAYEFSERLGDLSLDEFFFGFHPAPYASVGHLHMHVLPLPDLFRRYSTGAHDWKTIPASVVLEVLGAKV